MVFKKHDLIELPNGRQYEAVCVDESLAIFAPIKRRKDGGTNTRFSGMFAYTNQETMVNFSTFKRIEEGDLK